MLACRVCGQFINFVIYGDFFPYLSNFASEPCLNMLEFWLILQLEFTAKEIKISTCSACSDTSSKQKCLKG